MKSFAFNCVGVVFLLFACVKPSVSAAIDIDIELTYHSSLHETERILNELAEEGKKADAMSEAELREKKEAQRKVDSILKKRNRLDADIQQAKLQGKDCTALMEEKREASALLKAAYQQVSAAHNRYAKAEKVRVKIAHARSDVFRLLMENSRALWDKQRAKIEGQEGYDEFCEQLLKYFEKRFDIAKQAYEEQIAAYHEAEKKKKAWKKAKKQAREAQSIHPGSSDALAAAEKEQEAKQVYEAAYSHFKEKQGIADKEHFLCTTAGTKASKLGKTMIFLRCEPSGIVGIAYPLVEYKYQSRKMYEILSEMGKKGRINKRK